MNKQIVTESSSNLRRLARKMLDGNWGIAVLAVLITELVANIPSLMIQLWFPSGAAFAIENLYHLLVQAPLAVGLAMVLMNIARNRPTAPMNVFYGFEYMGKAILLQIVMGVFVFLWALLFVIPGIIASYRYRYAFYILADDPSKGVMQCLNESKYLTMGNKMKIFSLDLSFIGWYLLSSIPAGIFGGFYAFSHFDSVMMSGVDSTEAVAVITGQNGYIIGAQIASLAMIFVEVYSAMAGICLYDLANGNLTVRRVPVGGVGGAAPDSMAGGIPQQTGGFGDTQYPLEAEGRVVSETPQTDSNPDPNPNLNFDSEPNSDSEPKQNE